jgi:MoaA/NifB/PqqE/SkfB family radical SAM enzyme
MAPDVFAQALGRAVEFRDRVLENAEGDLAIEVNLCGLGEPLLNPNTPAFVQQVREAGFKCGISSNGALLDERRGQALLDAGLQRININVGDEGDEYEDVYKLPFEKTRDNVVRFAQMAGESCDVYVVLVNHRRDFKHVFRMSKYWRRHGIDKFLSFEIMNRAGALFVDEMQYESYPQVEEARALLEAQEDRLFCAAPFLLPFIGYDGHYYLCCSDWKKEVSMGTVFDESIGSVMSQKMEHVTTREPICKSCNHDPLNEMTEALRAIEDGESDESRKDEVLERLTGQARDARKMLALAAPDASSIGGRARRRIPIVAS